MPLKGSLASSGKSGDGLVDHGHTVSTILVVDTLPLVVHVVLDVDLTVDHGCHHVDKEEGGDGGENQSHEIARQTLVDHSVALEGAESVPKALVVGGASEGGLLLTQAWDLHVDASAQFSLHFESLDHLDDLALLLVDLREVGAYLSQVHVEVVFHSFFLFLKL